MDIKNTIISAEVVIESLITLLKNEGVDISSIQFSIGNKEKGTESADMSFESLIHLTLSWLNEAKNQAVPEGFILMPRICTNKMAHAAKAIDGRLSAFKYADVYKAMIEAQEPVNDSR